MSRLKEAMGASVEQVNAALDGYIPRSADSDGRLFDAMRYSVMAGGKRLRPALLLLVGALTWREADPSDRRGCVRFVFLGGAALNLLMLGWCGAFWTHHAV